MSKLRPTILSAFVAIGIAMGGNSAPAQAQVPAWLPHMDQIDKRGALPIDGAWMIREARQEIGFDKGHGYALRGWVHAGIFKIMPGHVVLTDLVEQPDGTIKGRDLPLMSLVTMTWLDDSTIRVQVHSLIPIVYHLDRIESDAFNPPQDPDESPGETPNPWPEDNGPVNGDDEDDGWPGLVPE